MIYGCCKPYVWAYQRSAQEYLAIKQELAEPDPLKLAWRDLIKQTIHAVVSQPDADPLTLIQQAVKQHVPDDEQSDVQALIVQELGRLHEGVLARYPFEDIETVSPRPMLFITGDQTHSKKFSEDAYQRASEPKELYLVPNAGHVDLYDRVELIPFDKLTSFFKTHLN